MIEDKMHNAPDQLTSTKLQNLYIYFFFQMLIFVATFQNHKSIRHFETRIVRKSPGPGLEDADYHRNLQFKTSVKF